MDNFVLVIVALITISIGVLTFIMYSRSTDADAKDDVYVIDVGAGADADDSDSDSDSDADSDADEDADEDADVEGFEVYPTRSYAAKQRHADLYASIDVNGIKTEETVQLGQTIKGMQPTVWLSGDRWARGVWMDASGHGNDVTAHNDLTQRTSVKGNAGCDAEFQCIGSDTKGGLKITRGWPKNKQYTLFHVSRYSGGSRGRIWNNVGSSGVNWLSGHHNGCVGRMYHNSWLNKQCTSKEATNWALTTDQYDYCRVAQAGGPVRERRIKNPRYRHPQNGIGINGWSHPWGRGSEVSDFEVAEVIVFDKILTKEQIRLVEGYLQTKYGFMK